MSFLLTKFPCQSNRSQAQDYRLNWCRALTYGLFALCTLCVLTSACGERPASLQERVEEYWDARIKGEAEKTYRLEAPGAPDKTAYLTKVLKSPIAFKSYTIRSIKENGDQAVAELELEYFLPGLSRPASSFMLDGWVKIKGQWYHRFPAGDGGRQVEERG